MKEMEQLQAAATSLLNKAENGTVSELAAAVEQTTSVLRLSFELQKTQAEVQKLEIERRKLEYENATASQRDRSDRRKEYASILTSIVPVIALAATVFLQSWQFTQSEEDKRDAAMEAQWQTSVKTILDTNKLPTGIVALQPFLNTPKYVDRARNTAVQLLATNTDKAFFEDLFGAAFVPASWNNLDYILRIDRALTTKVNPLYAKTYDPTTDANDRKKLASDSENALYDYADTAIAKLSLQVGSVLKTPRPDGVEINMSATLFQWADWSGVDLGRANLENAELNGLTLKGVNLGNITHFTGANFSHTAWWEAEEINPELRKYLMDNYKCDPNGKYGWEYKTKYTQQQCDAALAASQTPNLKSGR